MLPLFSDKEGKGRFMETVADSAEVKTEDILGHDLFLYDRTPGTLWGVNEEFVSAPRLDDLQCAFSSMEGFLQGNREESISVHCVLDNEEVGSSTRQGAASAFLKDTLMRINMRNMKIWHINNFLIIKQDIQIQCPWSPVNDTFPVCLHKLWRSQPYDH